MTRPLSRTRTCMDSMPSPFSPRVAGFEGLLTLKGFLARYSGLCLLLRQGARLVRCGGEHKLSTPPLGELQCAGL